MSEPANQRGGLTDSSRWLQRSENHRNKSEKSCTPKGREKRILHTLLIWHPVGVRSSRLPQPVVFASLRPPATFSQPSGLRRCTSKLNPPIAILLPLT